MATEMAEVRDPPQDGASPPDACEPEKASSQETPAEVSPSKEKEEIEPVGKDSDLKLAVAEAEAQQEAAERQLALVPQKASQRHGARNSLVPLYVEQRGHGKDGELLRDFILRRVHMKEDFRDVALKRWLIREDFFDEFFADYMKQYGVPGSASEAESERMEQLAEECKDILVPTKLPKKQVSDLEAVAASSDVYQLRDTLLAAVKDLSSPRRILGLATNCLMTDNAKETLALEHQRRLRRVVFQCLKGIWESGVGGEVLKMAMDAVRTRIDRFKSKAGESSDVIQAMAGQEWAQLEDLVQLIDQREQEAGGHRGPLGPVEGRRTKIVVDRALDALGGQGTLREVIDWIEQNPEELEELREAKLNRNIRDGRRKPVWHSTVGSTIASFRKVRGVGPPTRYLSSKAPEPEEPIKAIEDAPARKTRAKRSSKQGVEAGEAGTQNPLAIGDAPTRKPRAKRAPKQDTQGQDGTVGAMAAPKAKRLRKGKAADADPNAAAPPEAASETPGPAKQMPKASDPLARALDAAIEAAKCEPAK